MSGFTTYRCASCFMFLASPSTAAFKSPRDCRHHFCETCKNLGKHNDFCNKKQCPETRFMVEQPKRVDLTAEFETAFEVWIETSEKQRCEVHKNLSHIGGWICFDANCPNPTDGFTCFKCDKINKRHAGCDQQLDAKQLIEVFKVKKSSVRRLLIASVSKAAKLRFAVDQFTEIRQKIRSHLQNLSNLPDQFTSETFKIDYSFKKEGDYIIVHDKVLEEVEKILVEMLACQSTKADKLKFAELFTMMAKHLRVVDQKLVPIPKCHKSKQTKPIKAPKDVIGEDSDWEGLHEEEDQKDPEADPEDGDVMGMDDRGVDHMDASQHDDDKHLSTTKCCLCDSEDPNTKVIRTFAEDVSELAASQPSGTNHVLQVTGEGSIKLVDLHPLLAQITKEVVEKAQKLFEDKLKDVQESYDQKLEIITRDFGDQIQRLKDDLNTKQTKAGAAGETKLITEVLRRETSQKCGMLATFAVHTSGLLGAKYNMNSELMNRLIEMCFDPLQKLIDFQLWAKYQSLCSLLKPKLSKFKSSKLIFTTKQYEKSDVAKEFWEAVHGKENTLVIIKSGQYYAGGYAAVAWQKPTRSSFFGDHIPDAKSFLFSTLRNKVYDSQQTETLKGGIVMDVIWGPTFGGDDDDYSDLHVHTDYKGVQPKDCTYAPDKPWNYTNLGKGYSLDGTILLIKIICLKRNSSLWTNTKFINCLNKLDCHLA